MKEETKDETKRTPPAWKRDAPSTPADARGGTGDRSFDDSQKTSDTAHAYEKLAAAEQKSAMLETELRALRATQATESDLHQRHLHRLDEMRLESEIRAQDDERRALREELRRAEDRRYDELRRAEEQKAEEQRKARERERLEALATEERERVEAERTQIATIDQERIRLRNEQLSRAAPVALAAFFGGLVLGRWMRGGDA